MIFAKTTTYGLESQVKRIQNYLNDNLGWSGTLHIYGLIQKLEKSDSIIPEVYVSGKDYKQIFIDDRIAGTIGFLETNREVFPVRKATVEVIFTVDLKQIYPLSTTRESELALLKAQETIENCGLIMGVSKVKQGIKDVFSGFDTDLIKYRDMHPWFIFSFEVEIEYIDDQCQ